MHSIVVFGDVRTHQFFYAPSDGSQAKREPPRQYGGAKLLAKAIQDAIRSLPAGGTPLPPATATQVSPQADERDLKGPQVFSFLESQESDPNRREHLGFEYYDWLLTKGKLPEAKKCFDTSDPDRDSYRLTLWQKRPLDAAGFHDKSEERFPRLDTELQERLFNASLLFDPPENDAYPWCPDIVVFDDLSDSLRDIPIRKAGTFPTRVEVVPRSKRENRKSLFAAGLETLVNRLLFAGEQIRRSPQQLPLEPVIICCVGGRLPTFGADRNQWSLWDCLANHRVLAERTVVILDADELRDEERLAISSGLSWERTAQDTVAELWNSPRARKLFTFSQIIVRFGVTGALHVRRLSDATWNYELFFDPEYHDRSWTEPDSPKVLGYAAIFAATLIQQLTQICNTRREKPILHDLAEAVAGAVPQAIIRCQRFLHRGYDLPKFEEREGTISLLPKSVFNDDEGTIDLSSEEKNPWISSVIVPLQRNRSWSILRQVAQARTGPIARNIVEFGVRKALNQHVPGSHELIRRWVPLMSEILTGYLEEVDYDFSRIDFKEHVLGWTFYQILKDSVQLPRDHDLLQDEEFERILDSAARTLQPNYERFQESLEALLNDPAQNRPRDFDNRYQALLLKLNQENTKSLLSELRLPSPVEPRFDFVSAPLAFFGRERDYVLVDRREVESVRAVQKLIKAHLDNIGKLRDPEKHRPLSIAVFGPPGSGKSTAVKKIIEGFKGHPARPEVMKDPFNLAQFTDSADLHDAFDEILKYIARQQVPIAFFDEFDSRFQGEEWGWLKFFLSPMEDGVYRGKPVNTAIFVFAGGTSSTYSQFSLENRPSTDVQVQAFARAKGPDFVSRLRGYLNVVGVNPADSEDELYLIRRAIVFRSILQQLQRLGPDKKADIDADMLRASLFVPQYKNNARSIRTLLEISARFPDKRISTSTLPLVHQLNMLTDGQAFLDLLADVSANPRGNA
jgi:hypothetical protein